MASLAQDGCDLAGVHCRRANCARERRAFKEWLNPNLHRVIGFVTREMGLMVKRGNPLGIGNVERLLDASIRFVNRDPDSGTRLLLDQLLAQRGIDGAHITATGRSNSPMRL